MTDNAAESASNTPELVLISPEIEQAGPRFTHRIEVGLFVISAVWLAATPWAALLILPYGGLITFLSPLLLALIVFPQNSRKTKALAETYSNVVLSRIGADLSDENLRAQAKALFARDARISDIQGFVFLGFFIYLSINYIVIVVSDYRFSFSDLDDIALGVWASIKVVAGLFAALMYSAVFVSAVKNWEFSLDDLESPPQSILNLPSDERNDIDIAGLAIAIQALMRRAETYTIESTLLSALSFSAFVGIAFSDQGPIETSAWISRILSDPDCASFDRALSCVVNISGTVTAHIMYVVSATLLLTSVFFLSVLVIRFRFNEAYRYTEEILAIATVLNEKESNADSRKGEITSAISDLLEKAGLALDDLKPLGSAMKAFRNLGVFFFVLSVAVCGLYFHWAVALLLYGVVVTAYVVSFIDQFRRKSGFLPKLETVVMSIWHHKS